MLKEMHLENVGPASKFDLEFGQRLNLFTGDNGLGKTFLLDIAWWALTNTWVGHPARGQSAKNVEPSISFKLFNSRKLWQSKYIFADQFWPRGLTDSSPAGLVIYMRVDGSFSVWDSARTSLSLKPEKSHFLLDPAYNFTLDTLWNGLRLEDRLLCNGLIADWVKWQYQPDQHETSPFQLLKQVIEHLSPHPHEWMKPGKPTRISIKDVRDIPTIELPYGNVSIMDISAGMKRILSLAYLLIWTWYEHNHAATLRQQEPTPNMVLLIDEVESHLHPQWQRSLLPTILELGNIVQPKLKTQIIATTHSPLVLASMEPYFKEAQDRLFLLELAAQNVTLSQLPWTKQGEAIN